MYKKLLFTILLLSISGLQSQTFNDVDRKVGLYPPFSSLWDLGIRIQNDFESDSLRVRAAFIWLAHNITYGRTTRDESTKQHRITYSSEAEKEEAIDELVWVKINRAFSNKKGVCIDYSLMLNALFEQFGLASRVVTGVVKTKIEEIEGDPSYSNHSWNAVQVGGKWQLMDATWAAGFTDPATGRFIRSYSDHYFFTAPSDFIRHHLPSRKEWQLLDQPVEPETFYAAPIYLPEFCKTEVVLSPRTNGILSISGGEDNTIYFDRLPAYHVMHYTINGNEEFRRMGFRKVGKNAYTSRIKLRKRFNRKYDYLTVYMNDKPILNFRIDDKVANRTMMTDNSGQTGVVQNSD